MKLEIGKFYKIVFDVGGKTLTYQCEISGVDNTFVDFTDKFDKSLSFSICKIVSVEEIKESEYKGIRRTRSEK